ncbi:MAG: ArsR/SmtB family transcription factor [Turicibacter sp.]
MKTKTPDFENINEMVSYAKALSSEDRIKMLKLLDFGNFTINEMAEQLSIPVSTAGLHVKILEETGLILTRLESATRGTKKVCFKNIDEITFDLLHKEKNISFDSYYINMPIGAFSNSEIEGTCGLVSEYTSIGTFDNPAVFFYPEKYTAQLIWFETGYLEYKFPLDLLKHVSLESLEISFECCSEAPSYKTNWPSDITLSLNDIELHTFTSPGDFGIRKGKLNPLWWPDSSTQFGLLYNLRICNDGVYFAEQKVNEISLEKLQLFNTPYLTFKIEVKKDATYPHGINLFGEKFGDHDQNIVLRIDYSK